MAAIDDVLPRFDVHEVHSVALRLVDVGARRPFLRYWRVVGPFSALIRRRRLAQIAKRAR